MKALSATLSCVGYLAMLTGVLCVGVTAATLVIIPTLLGQPLPLVTDLTLPIAGVLSGAGGAVIFAFGRAAAAASQ